MTLQRRCAMSNPELIIEAAGVTRTYRVGTAELNVLRGVDYRVERGRWACLLGASGSGKTTLLNILGALEKPTAGTIRVLAEVLLNWDSFCYYEARSLALLFTLTQLAAMAVFVWILQAAAKNPR